MGKNMIFNQKSFDIAINWLLREHEEGVLFISLPSHYTKLKTEKENLLNHLKQVIENPNTYEPENIITCDIPKRTGGTRHNVGLLSLHDRLLLAYFMVEHFPYFYNKLAATEDVIDLNQPLLNRDPLLIQQEGFLPGYKKTKERLRRIPEGKHILYADIKDFAPSINTDTLVDSDFPSDVSNEWKKIIKRFFQGFHEQGCSGIPMASFVTNILLKTYLQSADKNFIKEFGEENYFRYNDDLYIITGNNFKARAAKKYIEDFLLRSQRRGLRLNQEKTRIIENEHREYIPLIELALQDLHALGHQNYTKNDLNRPSELAKIYKKIRGWPR